MVPGRWYSLATFWAIVLAMCLARPVPLCAAPIINPDAGAESADADDSDDEYDPGNAVFSRVKRTSLKRLAMARKLMATDRYAEAVRCLGTILESAEDGFLPPNGEGQIHRSLKAEARRMIGQMPRQGRELYELEYGAGARRMLARAIAAGDFTTLAEVSGHFFHTRAGYDATFLLGLHHFDHGRPLAGALTLRRLRETSPVADRFEPALSLAMATCWVQAGMPQKGRQALIALKQRHPDLTALIAGKRAQLFDEEAGALDWLADLVGPLRSAVAAEPEQWLMSGGNSARNASTAGGTPLLSMRWRMPTSDRPLVQERIEEYRQNDLDRVAPGLPALQPLVVNNVVLMRTAWNLLAVDFTSGKRLWEVPVDDPLDPLSGSSVQQPAPRRAVELGSVLRQRIWRDATYGTISSDGRLVFTIEDLRLGIGNPSRREVILPGGNRGNSQEPQPCNRLAAHEIRTGKLMWHVGGSADDFGLPLSGTFFLGPPLPLMGRLYVLGEVEGEIRLMVLDAANRGELLWSQQLAPVEQTVANEPMRALAGASPSFADGILVCPLIRPTTDGAVVAVDEATRSLLWGYQYASRSSPIRQQLNLIHLQAGDHLGMAHWEGWIDGNVILADGRVLLTPGDSDHIHCLNLIDGRLLWKQARGDDLYVACVCRGKVVLVGRQRVRALNLADGKPAWDNRTLSWDQWSRPSGRGFLAAGHYYLPLSGGKILAFDVDAGRRAGVSQSRKSRALGNLICYKGRVISQAADGVECFYQLDSLAKDVDRRLADKPHDAEALALRGEILWNDGKLAEAVDCFRAAGKQAPDPRIRTLLREALLECLRADFAAYRNCAEEIRSLIDEPEEEATFLRLMTVGLEKSGELTAAVEHCLKLIDLAGDPARLTPVGSSGSLQELWVRRDRWIAAELGALRQAAPEDVRKSIDKLAETRFSEARKQETAEGLRQFVGHFGELPIAQEARRKLVKLLRSSQGTLEAELLLRQLAKGSRQQAEGSKQQAEGSRQQAEGGATAELAAMLREAKRPRDAARCYGRLGEEFAEVICLEGKTGRELVENLPAEDPVQQWLGRLDEWPDGKVEVKKTPAKGAHHRGVAVDYQGDRAPFFREMTIEFEPAQYALVARDGLGNRQWSVPLVEKGQSRDFMSISGDASHARVCGHLLMLAVGSKILALDTLGAAGDASARVLWSRDVVQPLPGSLSNRQVQMGAFNFFAAGGMPHVTVSGSPVQSNSVLGPVTDHYVCYRRYHKLIAIDPLSGQPLWTRRHVPLDSALFGDDQFVFIARPEQTEATVVRAMDGKSLGTREIPSAEARMATLGRQILVWRDEEDHPVLGLFDPWQQTYLLPQRKFARHAKACLVGHEAVGVLEPDGHFVLLALPGGETIIDAEVEKEHNLAEIFVLPWRDQYLLVTNRWPADTASMKVTMQPLPRVLPKPILHGRVYGFDAQGNELWPEPVIVENQHLIWNQPSDLPVLVFGCQGHYRKPDQPTHYKTSILCIDKRSGRVVCREECPSLSGTFELLGDPQKKTVQVRLQRTTITMTFTPTPLAPQSDADTAPKEGEADSPPQANSMRAIWKVIKKAAGKAAGSSRRGKSQPAPSPSQDKDEPR